MVGMWLSKCLQGKSLSRGLLLVMMVCSFFGAQVAASGAVPGHSSADRSNMGESLMKFAPDTVTFEDVLVGDAYTQSVKITNIGQTTLQIKRISTSRPDFQVKGILLPVVVAHGTSESFNVSFRPKKEGRAEGKILIFTSSSDEPMVVTVRASTVVGQTELTASEARIAFEEVAVGGIGTKEVLLTNSGTRDLTISGISVTGQDFNVSGATGVRLTPGQSVSLYVNFAPKSPGRQSGQLTISGSGGGSLLWLPLTATGAQSSRSAVKLNWEESPVTVAGYVVYRSPDASGPYMRISQSATTEYVDTSLAAGHTYFYVVTSMDADQVESEFSLPISATVPEG